MKINFLVLILVAVTTFELFSQENKNSLYVSYSPQITKTDFNQILINNPLFFNEFYETIPPDKAIAGVSWSVGYIRKIKKNAVGFYITKNERGQKSDFAYNYRGLIPIDTSETFGGLYYTFVMESVSFGVVYERQITKKNKFYSALQVGLGLDIYKIARLKNFNINVQTGSLQRGCCLVEYSQTTKGGLSNLTEHFKDGFYRTELSFSFKNTFNISNKIALEASPQFFFLTKILRRSRSLDRTVPDGKVLAGGLRLGLHYNF